LNAYIYKTILVYYNSSYYDHVIDVSANNKEDVNNRSWSFNLCASIVIGVFTMPRSTYVSQGSHVVRQPDWSCLLILLQRIMWVLAPIIFRIVTHHYLPTGEIIITSINIVEHDTYTVSIDRRLGSQCVGVWSLSGSVGTALDWFTGVLDAATLICKNKICMTPITEEL